MKVCCPACGRGLEAPGEVAGRKGRCPFCGSVFTVPGSVVAATPGNSGAGTLPGTLRGADSLTRRKSTIITENVKDILKEEHRRRIADITREIELDPGVDAYNSRGTAFYLADDYDNAVSDFSRAIEMEPGSAVLYLKRGAAYRGMGEYAKAFEDYSKHLELEPQSEDADSVKKAMEECRERMG